MNSSLQILEELLPQTFEYKEHSKRNHPNQLLNLKVHCNQAQKPLETSRNHKSMKLYGFKPLKPRRTFTTNLRRKRTSEEHTKNMKNKGFLTNL